MRLRDLILYEPFKVLMYKEVISHCHEIAGSIPSNVIYSLQEFGCVMTRRQERCDVENVNIIYPFGVDGIQGEFQYVKVMLLEMYDLTSMLKFKTNVNFRRFDHNFKLLGLEYFVGVVSSEHVLVQLVFLTC